MIGVVNIIMYNWMCQLIYYFLHHYFKTFEYKIKSTNNLLHYFEEYFSLEFLSPSKLLYYS